jgi:geranylgeranyl diphosphate synthase type II
MMIYVYDFLNHLDSKKFGKAVELFNKTAIRVCEGQQYDLNFQTAKNVSVKEYLGMIEAKTASLLACSLQLGAIVAGAPDKAAGHLFEFGRNMGICFQLLDDLLDAFGEEGKTGKKIGGDIAQNKKTYLHIKAMEFANGTDKERLVYYFSNNVPKEEKVKHVLEVYARLGVEKLAREEAQKFNDAAFASFGKVKVNEERKNALKDFAELMFSRQS